MLTSLRMISVPITCSTSAPMIIWMPSGSAISSLHVLRSNHEHRGGQRRREAGENPSGDPSVRGQHPHLPLHLEPLADDRREVVEHLAEVAAGLALRQHGGDEEARVDERDARREAFIASGSGIPKFCWS